MKHLNIKSWAAKLDEDQMWAVFYKCRLMKWQDVAAWAMKEYGIERMPSQSAFYQWQQWMREQEHAHQLKQAIIAQNHARQVAAKYDIKAEDNIKQLMAMATSATIESENAKLGSELLEMAMAIQKCELEKQRNEIEEKKVAMRNEEINILKRRIALLEEKEAKTKKIVKTKMTPEEREAKLREIFGFND